MKKLFTIMLALVFMLTGLSVFAQATGAPPSISIAHDQWAGDIDGDFTISWSMHYGNNGTEWKLYEKAGALDYVVVESGTLPDNTPSSQSGAVVFTGKPQGTYTYYLELSNSHGKSTSGTVSVTSGHVPPEDIIVYGADDHKFVTQFTISQGDNNFTLECNNVSAPNFVVTTNNGDVITPSVTGTRLDVKGLKAGRSSIKIEETTSGTVRYVGVRVLKADGTIPGMPEYLSIGSVSEDREGDLAFWEDYDNDDTNKRMDIRYIYINGGPLKDGWRGWTAVDGARAIKFIVNSRKYGIIPYFVYYNIPDMGESYELDLAHMQDATYMEAYYKDLKFLLDICNEYGEDDFVGLVFEPDFLGYMLQQSPQPPDQLFAQVNTAYKGGVLDANDTQFPDTLKGLVQSINYTVNKYYPNAYYGWQYNLWAYQGEGIDGKGVIRSTDHLGYTEGLAFVQQVAKWTSDFYLSCGIGTYGADFVSIDKYGLDAVGQSAAAATDPAAGIWFWNADHWNNYLEFCKVLGDEAQLPVVLWQIPVGHINESQEPNPYAGGLFPLLTNEVTKLEDSAPSFFLGDTFKPGAGKRMDWFSQNIHNDPGVSATGDSITWASHMEKARDYGINSILFGAGVNASTDGVGSPPSDDYWWITKVQRYFKNPVPLVTGPGDTTPPTVPTNLAVTAKTATSISISWTASTDDKRMGGYIVSYNNSSLNTVDTTATISGLSPNTLYTISVKAKDAAGNLSASSTAINETTDNGPTPTPTATATATTTVTPTPTATATNTVTPTPTATATSGTGGCTYPEWTPGTYDSGIYHYNGHDWQCQWWTTAEPGTTGQWGAWKDLGVCDTTATPTPVVTATVTPTATNTPIVTPTNTPVVTATPTATSTVEPTPTATQGTGPAAWAPGVSYAQGDLVTYSGSVYKCLQPHTSLLGWEPANVASLWQKQ